ncbi:pseudouridine synthase [Algibacillus agarilyticus]|uniref:pseudouridine synthase n=1 Tax=Algibacillus agarilyticus TaxID=2234133 RepID=UPI000DCFF3A2|nr:pseudouridine synthase [Algibacillus agarilyticus]
MTIAKHASKLSLPQINPGVSTVLEYLIIKFPYVDADVWLQRMQGGKVHWHDGTCITAQSLFKPQQRVYYYREVENEPQIPFKESILHQDDHLIVVYKPHFLPVTPGGAFVNECLQQRLQQKTGIKTLQALHRLDRVTAGLVMFSVNPETRHCYHHLFETQQIHKTYQAIAQLTHGDKIVGKEWQVKNRIVRSDLRFRMQISEGKANSHSVIRCLAQTPDETDTTKMTVKALFELNPVTGKTHQLRLHMQTLGWPILNDKYYPKLQALSADDYSAPLQLLAKKIEFVDPITHKCRHFTCERNLLLN